MVNDSHILDQNETARWTRSECFVEFAVVHPEHQILTRFGMEDSPSRSWIDAVQVQLQSTCNTGSYKSALVIHRYSPRVVLPDPGGPYSKYLQLSAFHPTSKSHGLTLVCVGYLIESAISWEFIVDLPLFAYHAFSSSERKHWTSSRTSSFFDSGRMTDFHDLEGRAIGKYQEPL